jgi:hypothetical protein
MAKKKPQSQPDPQPEPRLPSPDGNWKRVTSAELDAYLERKLAPELTLKLSVVVASELSYALEQRALALSGSASATLPNPARANVLLYAKTLRAVAEKLKRACVEWHRKNPSPEES